MRSPLAIAAGLAALGALTEPAWAEGGPEPIVERLHSDLPLYTFSWKHIWPRSFHSQDSFGCETRVAWGNWRFIPADPEDGAESWDRYTNYGLFHCAAILRRADELAELAQAQWKYGFFIRLGKGRVRSQAWELWALQIGTVPGSDYVLLARGESEEGLIKSFRVLQRHCPAGGIREAEGLDIWATRYCRIESRADLLALARRMLRLPPLGTISWAAEAPEDD